MAGDVTAANPKSVGEHAVSNDLEVADLRKIAAKRKAGFRRELDIDSATVEGIRAANEQAAVGRRVLRCSAEIAEECSGVERRDVALFVPGLETGEAEKIAP